jgi:RNA polymerase sigma-70 factor (ECF subfamily)
MEAQMAAHSQRTTAELVDKAKRGEKEAFAELTRRCSTRLGPYIGSRIGPHLRGRLEVDEVLQETAARAFQSISRFEWRGEASFERWLETIAERVILEGVRLEQRLPATLDIDLPGSAPSPSKVARREERLDRFEQALDGLSPDHREVILLARIEGLKIKEIARRMNRSPDAIKQLLSRALKALRERFGDTESFHLPDRPLQTRTCRDSEE